MKQQKKREMAEKIKELIRGWGIREYENIWERGGEGGMKEWKNVEELRTDKVGDENENDMIENEL